MHVHLTCWVFLIGCHHSQPGHQDSLQSHRDHNPFSFVLQISSLGEFAGGGTRFLDADVRGTTLENPCTVSPGCAILFCGRRKHEGVAVSAGSRLVIAGFLDYHPDALVIHLLSGVDVLLILNFILSEHGVLQATCGRRPTPPPSNSKSTYSTVSSNKYSLNEYGPWLRCTNRAIICRFRKQLPNNQRIAYYQGIVATNFPARILSSKHVSGIHLAKFLS